MPRRVVLASLIVVAGWVYPLAAQDVPEVVRDLMERGDARRAQGQLDEAAAAYREALQLGPQVAALYASLGALYHQQGKSAEALETFGAGIAVAPRDRNLLYNGAVVALSLGKLEQARGWSDQAIQHHAKDFDLYLLSSAVLDRLEQKNAALERLLDAERLRPADAQVMFRLGNLYHAMGKSAEAVEAFRRALKKDPTLLRAQYNLGAVLFELGRNDEALEAYRIALAPIQKSFAAGEKVEPVHAVAFANLGAIYSQAKKWAEALDAFDKALKLDGQRAELWGGRGYAAFQLGKFDAAASDYEKLLAAEPKSGPALLHLGLIAGRKKDCPQAVKRLEQGLPSFDTAARLAALEPLAACYAALGRNQDAENAFRTVLADRPDDADLLFALGRLQRKQGKAAEAEELFTRADKARPNHLATGLELLAAAEKRGDLERQVALAEGLLKADGSAPWRLRFSLSLLYLENGRAREALPHLEQLGAAKNLPAAAKSEVARVHGLALAANGQYDEARKRLRAEPAGGGNALAFVEAMAGKSDAALAAMGKDSKGPAQRANLGLILWSLGRFDEARPHLEAADAKDLAVRAALGDLALRRGELGAALESWQAVAGQCGKNPPAKLAKLCAWTQNAQQQARLQAAFGELARALRGEGGAGGLRQIADDAVAATPAGDPRRGQVLYLRGSARLLAGDLDGAVADLGAALETKPGAELEAVLRNNLAVAQARLGRTGEARRLFEQARAAGGGAGGSGAATAALNLAILMDQEGKRIEALPFYLQYLQGDGSRRKEIERWVARLREVAP